MKLSGPTLVIILGLLAAPARGGTPVHGDVHQGLFGTCFANEREGWVVGELGRIFHTTDGGVTWERQTVDTKRPFFTISCLDARNLWVAGKEGIVYNTTNGGESWTARPTGSTRHVFNLQFGPQERGHGVGDFGTMIHTEDGGKQWAVMQVPPEITLPESAADTGVDPGDINLYGLSYADADHLWVVGEFGTIMASADGGRTFRQQHGPYETTLFGVYFTTPERGWAVGIDSVILRTVDGGATWAPVPAPVAQRSYYDVMVRGDRGWIVGSSGTILRSDDGGATWAGEKLPIELAVYWIRSVFLTPSGTGLAVGAEGLAFRINGTELQRVRSSDSGRKS